MSFEISPAPALEPNDSFAVQQWMLSIERMLTSTDFDEEVQDVVGGILVDSSRINFTYDDTVPSITADLIADSVDNTYLSNMAQSTIKGRAAGAGTGDPTDLTVAQVVTMINASLDHGTLLGLSDNDHPQYLLVADIDDTPVNGEVAQPISSNWAFDHVAAADPHTGYRLESADHNHQSTGAEAGQLDHGLALTGLTDDDHTQYLLASDATNRTTFAVNWTDLTDGGTTSLHTHAASGVTNFHALVATHVSLHV